MTFCSLVVATATPLARCCWGSNIPTAASLDPRRALFPGSDQPADRPNLVPGDSIVVAAPPALGIAETQTVIGPDLIAAGVAGVVELWPRELPAEHQPPPPPPRPQVEPGSWFADLPE
jgi:hypothetical protein